MFRCDRHFRKRFRFVAVHLRIGMALAFGKSCKLHVSCSNDTFPNPGGTLPCRRLHQILRLRRRNSDLDIDPVKHRARNPLAIPPDRIRQTRTFPFRVHRIAARAGIHRGSHHKPGRPRHRSASPANMDDSFFHRFAQSFQDIPVELRKFVQKKHSVMGKARFAGSQPRATADKGNHR